MEKLDFVEHQDRWVFSDINAPLLQVVVRRFQLLLDLPHNDTLIQIEFIECHVHDAACKHFVSVSNTKSLHTLFDLLRMNVLAITAYKHGELEIAFENEHRLLCAPDDNYEAWQIQTSAGQRIISTPGGELAIWG